MRKILTLLLLILLSSIYAKTGSEKSKDVNIAALKGPTGLSMVKLVQEKDNLNTNLNVNYKVVNTPDLIVSGLLSGEYDIATLPTNLAAILFNKMNSYTLISVTGNGTLYMVSSRDDINKWNDLKGKKINNIARSSTPGFLFNHFLSKNDISRDELEVDYRFNHLELAPMLIAGKIETGILPEPLVTKVLTSNRNMSVVIDFQKEYKNLYGASYPLSCVVASKSFIKNNPDIIRNFLISLKDSINWVNDNPFNAGEMGKEIGLGTTGDLINEAISRLNLIFKTSEESKRDILNYYNILYEIDPKSVGGKIPASEFFLEQF